jgi:hypothetical protein
MSHSGGDTGECYRLGGLQHGEKLHAQGHRPQSPNYVALGDPKRNGWRVRGPASGTQPVCDPDTHLLQTGAQEVAAAWGKHFSRLAADVSGHSRDRAYWASKWGNVPHREPLDGLNGDLMAAELSAALSHLKAHKAPGSDGVPADVLKLLAFDVQSDMGKALLRLLNAQWRASEVPEVRRNSVVVSIPKKGDMTDMGNYWGISLIVTVLKLLAVILSARLNSVFESAGLFSRAQAGFASSRSVRRKWPACMRSQCVAVCGVVVPTSYSSTSRRPMTLFHTQQCS